MWGGGMVLIMGLAGAASDDPLRLARAAERAGDPVAEVQACARVLEQTAHTPASDRAAVYCEGRLVWLEARRDTDGSFDGLTRLEAARRDGGVADVEALVRDPVISEVLRWEGQAWLARHCLDTQDDAQAALVWSQPLWEALREREQPALLRRQAADLHSRALASLGRADEALAVEAVAHPPRANRPQEGPLPILMERRRALGARWAWGVVGVFGVLGVPLAVAGWRRRPRPVPLGLGLLSLVALAWGALGVLRDSAVLYAFVVLGLAMGAVHLVSAGGALWLQRPGARAAWGLLAAAASLAVSYLVLRDFGLLDSVGL